MGEVSMSMCLSFSLSLMLSRRRQWEARPMSGRKLEVSSDASIPSVLKSKASIALLAKSGPSRPAILTFNIRQVGRFVRPQKLVVQRSNFQAVGRYIGDLKALRQLRRLRRLRRHLNHHEQ